MKKSIFILFSISLLFYACKNENENHVENIKYFRKEDAPGPDKIEFYLSVSEEVNHLIHEDSLTRQIFVINKTEILNYPAFFFGLEKLKNNKVKYTFVTPYFSVSNSKLKHMSENELNEYFNKSKDLKLILHFNKNVFEFKNK